MERKSRNTKKDGREADERIITLVSNVKNNDTASFLELLGLFSHTISSIAHSFSLPMSEQEDLCQEGRMALYRAALGYDETGSAKFSTYAITCMTNAMITFAKKYKAQNGGNVYGVSPEDCVSQVASGVLSFVELDELLSTEGFANLSSYERRVMSLKLSGYKVSEIAKIVGKEAKSIENTLFRARKKLKEHLNG